MRYYNYYLEIKNRVFLVAFSWMSTFLVSYVYKEQILISLVTFTKFLNSLNSNNYLIFTNITDLFFIYFKLILFISNCSVLLFFSYQLFCFLKPGMYKKEILFLNSLFLNACLSIVFSVFIVIPFLMPISWDFFLSFSTNLEFDLNLEANIISYVAFILEFCLISFLVCFIIFLTFSMLNKQKDVEVFKKTRKFFYFLFFIFSTLITPPDIFSQIFISFFLILFFELLIFVKSISKVTN